MHSLHLYNSTPHLRLPFALLTQSARALTPTISTLINAPKRSLETRVMNLEPGLVQIKQGLSLPEQVQLADMALKRGSDPTYGFWKFNEDGTYELNSAKHRGRMFGALTSFPPVIAQLCQRNINLAVQSDKTLKPVIPTHLILLYYQTLPVAPKEGYIPWHRDNGENDGEGDYPVVSFAIGDRCDFLINHDKLKVAPSKPLSDPVNLAHRVSFESGDVLLFGGPCRKIWHAIHQIDADTAPANLPIKRSRLNFTFRYTPQLVGREAEFATVAAETLKNQPNNPFYKL